MSQDSIKGSEIPVDSNGVLDDDRTFGVTFEDGPNAGKTVSFLAKDSKIYILKGIIGGEGIRVDLDTDNYTATIVNTGQGGSGTIGPGDFPALSGALDTSLDRILIIDSSANSGSGALNNISVADLGFYMRNPRVEKTELDGFTAVSSITGANQIAFTASSGITLRGGDTHGNIKLKEFFREGMVFEFQQGDNSYTIEMLGNATESNGDIVLAETNISRLKDSLNMTNTSTKIICHGVDRKVIAGEYITVGRTDAGDYILNGQRNSQGGGSNFNAENIKIGTPDTLASTTNNGNATISFIGHNISAENVKSGVGTVVNYANGNASVDVNITPGRFNEVIANANGSISIASTLQPGPGVDILDGVISARVVKTTYDTRNAYNDGSSAIPAGTFVVFDEDAVFNANDGLAYAGVRVDAASAATLGPPGGVTRVEIPASSGGNSGTAAEAVITEGIFNLTSTSTIFNNLANGSKLYLEKVTENNRVKWQLASTYNADNEAVLVGRFLSGAGIANTYTVEMDFDLARHAGNTDLLPEGTNNKFFTDTKARTANPVDDNTIGRDANNKLEVKISGIGTNQLGNNVVDFYKINFAKDPTEGQLIAIGADSTLVGVDASEGGDIPDKANVETVLQGQNDTEYVTSLGLEKSDEVLIGPKTTFTGFRITTGTPTQDNQVYIVNDTINIYNPSSAFIAKLLRGVVANIYTSDNKYKRGILSATATTSDVVVTFTLLNSTSSGTLFNTDSVSIDITGEFRDEIETKINTVSGNTFPNAISSPANEDGLIYNSTTGQFENGKIPGGSLQRETVGSDELSAGAATRDKINSNVIATRTELRNAIKSDAVVGAAGLNTRVNELDSEDNFSGYNATSNATVLAGEYKINNNILTITPEESDRANMLTKLFVGQIFSAESSDRSAIYASRLTSNVANTNNTYTINLNATTIRSTGTLGANSSLYIEGTIAYNGRQRVYRNAPSGSGGGATTFNDLTDTDIESPEDYQVPIWDAVNNVWINDFLTGDSIGNGEIGTSKIAGSSVTRDKVGSNVFANTTDTRGTATNLAVTPDGLNDRINEQEARAKIDNVNKTSNNSLLQNEWSINNTGDRVKIRPTAGALTFIQNSVIEGRYLSIVDGDNQISRDITGTATVSGSEVTIPVGTSTINDVNASSLADGATFFIEGIFRLYNRIDAKSYGSGDASIGDGEVQTKHISGLTNTSSGFMFADGDGTVSIGTPTVEFASNTEAQAGTIDNKAVPPSALESVLDQVVHTADFTGFQHTTSTGASMALGTWNINTNGTVANYRPHTVTEQTAMVREFKNDKRAQHVSSRGEVIEYKFAAVPVYHTIDGQDVGYITCTIGEHDAIPSNPDLTGDWSIVPMPAQNKEVFEHAPAKSIQPAALSDGILDFRHARRMLQKTVAKMRASGNFNATYNGSTRFTTNRATSKRGWAIGDGSGTDEATFDQIDNFCLVSGSLDFNTMRAESGGKYECRLDGIGTFYCTETTNAGIDLGLQFRHKATSTNTWGSWQDCKLEDISETIGGSSVTTYDVSKLYGSTSTEGIQRDTASGNARFHSIFRTKIYGNTGHQDISPPFWVAFIIGDGGLFPVTDRDYQFRFAIFPSDAGATTVRILYDYSEILATTRVA